MIVGCIPNSPDFSHPADRRRYAYYFEKRGIYYEYADFEKSYDAVYISVSADLSKWASYKKTKEIQGIATRVVFDLSDAYLSATPLSDFLRSLYYYLSGRTSNLSISYRKIILEMMAGSDVVLCGSVEQKKILDTMHHNVVVMRDYFEGEIVFRKNSFQLQKKGQLHLFWEGFSHGNLSCFKLLKNIVNRIHGFEVHLHIVTDPWYCRIGGSYYCKPTIVILKDLFKDTSINLHLYDWCEQTFSAIAASCDFAIIPIPNDPIMQMKPENKLLLLWSIGLPAIVSNTASYNRVMDSIGQNFTADSIDDWVVKINELSSSESIRSSYINSAKLYLVQHCLDSQILNSWDCVFMTNSKENKS